MPRKKSKVKILKEECKKLIYELAIKWFGKECEICGSTENLIVHHLVPRKLCKELIYEPLNLVVLCKKCHFELHKKQNPFIVLKIASKRGRKWMKDLEKIFKEKRGAKYPSRVSFLSQAKSKLLILLERRNEN